MDRWGFQRLRVLIVGQQNSFDHVLAANIRCWGHEAVVLPSAEWVTRMDVEAEGDVLLYDLDTSFRISPSIGERDTCMSGSSAAHGSSTSLAASPASPTATALLDSQQGGAVSALPTVRRRFTIAMSSYSISRMALEQIGAVALLYKPFEMGQLQRYFHILQRLLLEGTDHSRPHSSSNGNMRVLVVDDDVHIAQAIRQCLLDELHYDVAVAHNGLEALEQFLDWHPRCVVTDLIMPWMNGYQVIRCLAGTLCTMPGFVVMSALNHREMPCDRSYLTGSAVAYIDKPFQIDHLLTAVERVCSA